MRVDGKYNVMDGGSSIYLIEGSGEILAFDAQMKKKLF